MTELVTTGWGSGGLELPASNIDADVRLVYAGINEPGRGSTCAAEEIAVSLRNALLALDSGSPDFVADHDYLPHDLPRPRLRDALIRALGYWEARYQFNLDA